MKLMHLQEDENGAVMVEAGITLSVVLATILGTLYWLITLWQFNTVHFAADQAARCYAMAPPAQGASAGSCNANTANYVQNFYVAKAYGINAKPQQVTLSVETPSPLIYQLQCVSAVYPSWLGQLTIGGIFVFGANTELTDKTCYPNQ